MITKDQIRFLLSDIENERVERTISTKDTDKFAKAICAFANDLPNKRKPGYLLVGAFDDGTLNGLKVTDKILRNLAGLRADGNIQPKPALMVEKFSFPEGDIAAVEVQPSKNTPVKYKGVTYVRIGARKAEANEEEERILREKSEVKSPTFDTTPCTYSIIDDLDTDLFKKEYLPKFVKASVLKSDKRTLKQQLASLKLFDLAFDCPTVAGILLTGKDPKHILFGSYIQYVQFAGKSRTSKVLNERQFSGNLLTMLKELDYFIKYTIQKQRPVFVTVLREEMIINYPYGAIRELAMNLVMHRNYQTNAPAKFYEYSDRIEMDNPGNLYGKVRPDNFPNENDYRNPIIANAMKAFGYVNSFGRGINMVQEELEANRNGLAMFKFDDITSFKVTVMNADLDAVKAMENDAEMVQKNGVENGSQNLYKQEDIKNIINENRSAYTKTVQKNGAENSTQNTYKQEDINTIIDENINAGAKTVQKNGAENSTQNTYKQEDINTVIDENINAGAKTVQKNGAENSAQNTYKQEDINTIIDENINADTKTVQKNGAENRTQNTDKQEDINTVIDENINAGAKTVQKNGAEKTIILEQKILKLIRNKNTISRKSIAKRLGIGTTTAYRYIESLKKRGFIERIGSDKGGFWKIKNNYKTNDKIATNK